MGMLNSCAADLKAKEIEVKALSDKVQRLQGHLKIADENYIKMGVGQGRFENELKQKDEQITLHANTSNELAAELTRQHKELTKQIESMAVNHQQELAFLKTEVEAKDRKLLLLEDEVLTQKAIRSQADTAHNEEIARRDSSLHRLMLNNEDEVAKRVDKVQRELEEQYGNRITEQQNTVTALKAENAKLYAQLSTEDILVGDDDADEVRRG
ncbi:hypothetical protein N0V94_003801 [Neodidymelliopsis sp. IMI 364377]|nr:hypothetical protein N0V94_003801 [Neodidymelliopsis sp. IMI 364377]